MLGLSSSLVRKLAVVLIMAGTKPFLQAAFDVMIGEHLVPNSVLDAIKMGIWDFEPEGQRQENYEPTASLPGSGEKLAILSERVREGLPLWHPEDRRTYDDSAKIPE